MRIPQFKPGRWILVMCTVFLLTGYIIYPLSHLFHTAFWGSDHYSSPIRDKIIKACLNSILLAVLTVIGSGIIGTYFAYIMQYKRIFLKQFFALILLAPLAMPPIVNVTSFSFLLNENGLLARLLGLEHFRFAGWPAIIAIHLFSFYPLYFLFVGKALKTVDSSIIEAAHGLGSNNSKVFLQIILPQVAPAFLNASLLVFMASMASFSAPFLFGGAIRFLSTEIYYAKINQDLSLSASLSLLLTAISISIFILLRYYGKANLTSGTKGTAKFNSLANYAKLSMPATLVTVLFSLIIILPIFSMFMISLTPEKDMMSEGANFSFSMRNFGSLITNSDLFSPLLCTIQTSICTIIITLILSLGISHLLGGKRSAFKAVLEFCASLPYGIPGTVIGICLILSFSGPNIFSFNQVLVGSFWILPIAYSIRNLPILTQSLKSGINTIDRSIGEAAESLGASPIKKWLTVTLPLLAPSIIDGSLLVWINASGEFVATILLYTYTTRTIPIEIYSDLRMFNNGIAAGYGVLLFSIVLFIILLTKLTGKKNSG